MLDKLLAKQTVRDAGSTHEGGQESRAMAGTLKGNRMLLPLLFSEVVNFSSRSIFILSSVRRAVLTQAGGRLLLIPDVSRLRLRHGLRLQLLPVCQGQGVHPGWWPRRGLVLVQHH